MDKDDRMQDKLTAEIRAEIARQRVTRRQIANQTGINERTLRRYLNNETHLPLAAFYRLCHTLNIDPSTTLKGVENDTPIHRPTTH